MAGSTVLLLGILFVVGSYRGSANLHSSYLPGGNGDSAGYAHLPAVASNELVGALHALQREASVEAPVSREEVQQLQGEMLLSLGKQLDMGTAEAPARRLN